MEELERINNFRTHTDIRDGVLQQVLSAQKHTLVGSYFDYWFGLLRIADFIWVHIVVIVYSIILILAICACCLPPFLTAPVRMMGNGIGRSWEGISRTTLPQPTPIMPQQAIPVPTTPVRQVPQTRTSETEIPLLTPPTDSPISPQPTTSSQPIKIESKRKVWFPRRKTEESPREPTETEPTTYQTAEEYEMEELPRSSALQRKPSTLAKKWFSYTSKS